MKFSTLFIFIIMSVSVWAQKPIYINSFEPGNKYNTAKGIVGTALDLSADAPIRKVQVVKNNLSKNTGDFSVMIWVKAAISIAEEYDVLSSTQPIKVNNNAKGWRLGVQANGAWFWESRSNASYEYHPTPQRQTLKDGKWHLIAFTCSKAKNETRLYYDGLNVAIYFTPGLDSLNCDSLSIGGRIADPSTPSTPYHIDQWDAFNGFLDQVQMFNETVSPAFINQYYNRYFPSKRKPGVVKNVMMFKAMNYNIFHGGNETGKEVGEQRIVDVIKNSGADIISMQETYGSGARIADKLGYYLYLRSTNLSIMSRYPIDETLDGYNSFNNGGAYIDIPNGHKIAFFADWFTYPFDYWDMLEKHQAVNADSVVKDWDKANTGPLRKTLQIIKPYTDQSEQVPVIFCGDFNSGSHLDWVESTKQFNSGLVIPFPSSLLLIKNNFKDSFREVHPDPLKDRGITWSPMETTAFKDRIDYIYYKGSKLQAIASKTIGTHPVKYPSDHAAMLTTFIFK